MKKKSRRQFLKKFVEQLDISPGDNLLVSSSILGLLIKCKQNKEDFNPNIMLILDDCASQFKKWYKKSSIIKQIFYEGRWRFFTTVITAQDDKEIDSD